MDAPRFDAMARSLSAAASRRGLLRGAAAMLGLTTTALPARLEAKKKRRRKPTLNAYDCLDVGQPCHGNNALCCSGICQGKKPKKGKKDRRACAAHDAGSCTAGQDSCLQGNIACGTTGICVQTTGKSGYCGATGICAVCQKDEDCVAMRGPGSACVVCAAACANSTGGTACYAAAD